VRGIVATPALVLGQDRHERLRKGALREHPTQDVGQAERRLERIHLHSGAEKRRLQRFPDKTGDPRQQRHAADGG
jgi:hypothetical protein